MKQKIADLTKQIKEALDKATTLEALEAIRLTYFARQGIIADIMKQLKTMSSDEKRTFGPLLNEFKQQMQQLFNQKKTAIEHDILETQLAQNKNFDVTAELPHMRYGSLHPYTKITEEIEDIFISMGFAVADGPELETEFYSFDALNIPQDHPAREESDTFWLPDFKRLLRSQTSTIQIHHMQNNAPPIAVISPGRVFRNEATDASHDFMFMQVEGLFIDKNVSVSNLLAVLQNFLKQLFKKDIEFRVRPGFFPFVEPGLEIDASCPFCDHGCSTCKKTGWIELLGAGLIHPHVLEAVNIDPNEYSGFAFGTGLTRLAMLKYNITDIRLIHSNKIKFFEQF